MDERQRRGREAEKGLEKEREKRKERRGKRKIDKRVCWWNFSIPRRFCARHLARLEFQGQHSAEELRRCLRDWNRADRGHFKRWHLHRGDPDTVHCRTNIQNEHLVLDDACSHPHVDLDDQQSSSEGENYYIRIVQLKFWAFRGGLLNSFFFFKKYHRRTIILNYIIN